MVKKNNSFGFIIGIISLLSISILFLSVFVSAPNVLTPATYENGLGFSRNEGTNSQFNITVNNTNVNQVANISQINITLPPTFVFNALTNITSADIADKGVYAGLFTNTTGTGAILSWTNSSGYIINGSVAGSGNWSFFTFNVSAAIPGTYNFTVTTANATAGVIQTQNISVQINDTTAPFNVSFQGATPAANSTLNRNFITVNVTVNDSDLPFAGTLDTIRVYLFYANGTLVNSTNSTTNNVAVNFTNLPNGAYHVNATANDTAGNINTTGTSTLSVTLQYISPKTTPATYENGLGFSRNESTNNEFNITLNNTFIGSHANITQVNITVPPTFVFNAGTNITASDSVVDGRFAGLFTNTTGTGAILSWTNATGFIINGTLVNSGNWSFFTFNLSSPIPGNYNITVTTVNNTGGTATAQNISVQINDTTQPFNVSFQGATPAANSTLSRNFVTVNVTVNDSELPYAGTFGNITVNLYYINGTLINTTITPNNNVAVNFTNLPNGRYHINATANDTAGNTNTTGTSTLTVTLQYVSPKTTPATYETALGFSKNENITNEFNITLNNTFIGAHANITQINITVPETFTFVSGTNITAASSVGEGHFAGLFTNTTGTNAKLSWTNATGFIINGTLVNSGNWSFFTFNLSSPIPGNYNITVTTANDSGSVATSQNISVQINDTTQPFNVSFVNVTPTGWTNLSRTWFTINVSVNDSELPYAGTLHTVRYYVFYSNGTLFNNTNTTINNDVINFTSLPNAIYHVNATANDTAGNANTTGTGTRFITIDTVSPVVAFTCDSSTVARSELITCACTGTDTTSGVKSTNFTTNPSTVDSGTYTTSCTVTDYADQTTTSSFTYTVVGSSSSSSGGGGGTSSSDTWTLTKGVSDDKFKSGYTDSFARKQRAKVKVSNEDHYVGVKDITNTTVKIEVSSTPQEATLTIGEEKKFDVDNNNYYDILVKLNSIANNRANVTITSINEKVIEEVVEPQVEEEKVIPQVEVTSKDSSIDKRTMTIVLIVIILLVAIVGTSYFMAKKRK